MDTAKMPHNSDQPDNSDDLIAELARLMAEDAKGDSASADAAPEPEVEQETPAEDKAYLRAPGQQSAPAQSAAQTEQETGSARQSPQYESSDRTDRFEVRPDNTEGQDSAEHDLLREIERSVAAAEKSEEQLAGGTKAESQPSAQDPAQMAATGLDDAVIAEQDDGNTQQTPADEMSSLFGSSRQTSEATPQGGSNDDPIADLIRERDKTEPHVESRQAAHTPAVPEPFEGDSRSAQNEQAPEQDDSFSVAPVLGLGGASQVESGQTDPLDEIESLIGNAVRDSGTASRHASEAPKSAPAPTTEPKFDDAATAAEAAIMAATQASGDRRSEVGSMQRANHSERTEPGFTHFDNTASASETPEPIASEQRETGGSSSVARWGIAAAALLLIGLIGGGAYWFFGTGPDGMSGTAPVLASNTTDAKQDVEPTDVEVAAGNDSVVMNELEGNNEVPASEALVSRDQSGDVAGDSSDGAGGAPRVIAPEGGETGLANRKVRTVTVRPDGTIISGEDVLAGSEVLPVDRPDVPELPEGTTGADDGTPISEGFDEGTVEAAGVTSAETPDDGAGGDVNAAAGELVVPPGAPAPAPRRENRTVTAAVAQQVLSAPAAAQTSAGNADAVNSGTPAGAIDLLGNPVNVAPSSQTSTPVETPSATQTATTPVNNGASAPAYVQLSSQRTQEAAQETIAALNSRFASQLGDGNLEVQRVDLQDRGVFYRVRLPASSVESANSICANIQSAGGDCFVRTN